MHQPRSAVRRLLCLVLTVGATLLLVACVPLEGKSTRETWLDGGHLLQSTLWNTDGVSMDAWQNHTIGEFPNGAPVVRVWYYQAKRTWRAQAGFHHPTWSGFSSYHGGCSTLAYFDLPDQTLAEAHKVEAFWKSNHTGGNYHPIGTHEYGV